MDSDSFYSQFLDLKTPTPPQRRVYDAFWGDCRPPALTVCVLPTGEGKTEAAVAPFLAQFANGAFPIAARLIYVLPTRALTDRIRERIQVYAGKVQERAGAAAAVAPGDGPAQQPSAKSLAYTRRIVVEAQHGASPHDPFFFADVVVTTLDQFVYGYARAQRQERGHPDLAAGAIAASLVVFDEAHGYSAYTLTLLKAMLEILYRARIPVILMSATLPDRLRADLTGHVPQAEQRFVTVQGSPGSSSGSASEIRVKRQVPLLRQSGPLFDEGASSLHPAVLQRLRHEERALIVCNTVPRSQQVYKALRAALPGRECVLVHSRFTNGDRAALERKVDRLLSEKGPGGIVISTQVCEAGLNISADFLATEFAPADALVQRGGRCGRFMINGQPARGEVWVFDPDEAATAVYGGDEAGKQALEATEAFLRSKGSVDLGRWDQVVEFCRQLPYHTNSLAAAESLRELQEATLYADHAPYKIRVREELNAYLWLGETAQLEAGLSGPAYRQRLLSVPVWLVASYGERLARDKKKLERIWWEEEKRRYVVGERGTSPLAFQTFRLAREHYSAEEGAVW